MGSEDEKLDALSDRISQAEGKVGPKPEPSSVGRIGFDFVGSIGGAGIVGALLDHAFGTSPWCLVGMIIFGFCVGIWSAWRTMQKSEDK